MMTLASMGATMSPIHSTAPSPSPMVSTRMTSWGFPSRSRNQLLMTSMR